MSLREDFTPWHAEQVDRGEARTYAQENVLRALRIVTADGWPASVRELLPLASLASTSTVQAHLEALRAQGLAEQHPRRPGGGWKPTGDSRPDV